MLFMNKFTRGALALCLLQACGGSHDTAAPDSPDEILVVVKRNYTPRTSDDTVRVVLAWDSITQHLPAVNHQGMIVTDLHIPGRPLSYRVLDGDDDDAADQLEIIYPFVSNEPQYTLSIHPEGAPPAVTTGTAMVDERLGITYLEPYDAFVRHDSVVNWPVKIVESTLSFYPDPATFTIISPDSWNYEHGFFLNAMFEVWQRTQNPRYLQYIQDWTDRFLTAEGRIREDKYNVEKYRLDDILPGRLCLFLYAQTGDEKYKVAADQLKDHLLHQPKTSEGGYWHKEVYPNQMWLDGIYMADVFTSQYARVMNDPMMFDEAVHQINVISSHTKDSITGLYYHGWDESHNKVWADSVTGTSSSFWGRAVGWYFMALMECLDNLPADHPDHAHIAARFTDLAQSLARYQDEQSHLWYQVLDRGHQPDNWIETSCSAMFAYGFAKGYNLGLLDESYRQRAQQAFQAIIADYTYYDAAGRLYLAQTVKVGTLNLKVSKGDYAYYVHCERRINDYKGLAALLYAALALEAPPA